MIWTICKKINYQRNSCVTVKNFDDRKKRTFWTRAAADGVQKEWRGRVGGVRGKIFGRSAWVRSAIDGREEEPASEEDGEKEERVEE